MDYKLRQERELQEYRELLAPVLGQWQLTGLVGAGSYGKVFRLERSGYVTETAALKVVPVPQDPAEVDKLLAGGTPAAELKKRYDEQEQQIVSEFVVMYALRNERNVVRYEDHEVLRLPDGISRLVLIRMELLSPLEQYLRQHGLNAWPEQVIRRIGLDIGSALRACHSQNPPLLHRDIKPENIFYMETASGEAVFKLGDFGIARRMDASSSMSHRGTLDYMAPEVVRLAKFDHRADLYSLGLVLYTLANGGYLPFLDASSSYQDKETALERRVNAEALPLPTGCGRELGDLILHCCAYRQEDRYQTAAEVCGALLAADKRGGTVLLDPPSPQPRPQPSPEPSPRPSPGPSPSEKRGGKRIAVIAGAAALVLVAALALVLPRLTGKEPQPTAPLAATGAPATAPTAGLDAQPDADPLETVEQVTLGGQSYASDTEALRLPGLALDSAALEPLSRFTGLTLLNLDDNQLTSLSALDCLTTLEKLSVQGNRLTTLDGCQHSAGLRELYAANNALTALDALTALTALERLTLSGNAITDIAPLAGLTALERLNLAGNGLTDISALENLQCLKVLDLSENAVKDVGPLVGLSGLETLMLGGNRLQDVSALGELGNLKLLVLTGNKLEAGQLAALRKALPDCFIEADFDDIRMELQPYQYIYTGSTWSVPFTTLEPADLDRSLLEWQTEDPAVATVDAVGLVSAHSAGHTVVSASFNGQSTQMDVYVVDRAANTTAPASGEKTPAVKVEVTPSSVSMEDGQYVTIKATADGHTVSWSTSNDKVAEITSVDGNTVVVKCSVPYNAKDGSATATVWATSYGVSTGCRVEVHYPR